jgi:hypothetical protein
MSRQIYAVCLKCFFSLVLLISFAMSALAQSSSSAAVNGTVQDTTDARIPNATVKLISTTTGTESYTKTSKDGNFTLSTILPGQYTLQIERDGFDTTQLTGITLNVGDNRGVVIHMKVGTKNETISVDGSGLTINTTDGSVSTVIDRKFVANIPLNGRSFQDLISLTPGVVNQSPQESATQLVGGSGDFSVNGQRTESNNYLVDGVNANINPGYGSGFGQAATGGTLGGATALGTTQTLLSVDALQEFRVESSTYSAEYGGSPGGQFSLATRAGTSAFHGSAYDYLRNNFFDANDWFNDHYGSPTPALRQNDFGGTLGGPVRIPHLYNKTDRTFFFASYEGLRLTQPTAATIQYVPDLYMRQQAVPAIQPILNAFPLPNGIDYGSANSPNLAQFIAPFSLPSSIDSTIVRLDHVVSANLSFFFRFGDTPSSTISRPYLARATTSSNATTYTLGSTAQLSSRIVNEFRLGYARSDSSLSGTLDNFGGGTPINLTSAIGASSVQTAEPLVAITTTGLGQSILGTPFGRNQSRQWNLVDTVSISAGRHNLKIGVNYRYIKSPLAPPDSQPFADFLDPQSIFAGAPDLSIFSSNKPATPIFKDTALFAQDEWRIHPRLNLSLGLRWEVSPPPTEEHGDDAFTLLGTVSNPSSLSLAPQGTPLWKTGWFDFAPRVGLAWTAHNQPGAETIVRSGGGVFFDTANEIATLGYSSLGFSAYQIAFGVPIPYTPSEINVPTSVTAPYTAATVIAFPSNLQLPYTLEWNVSIQQALGKAQSFTATYVGADARRLLNLQQFSLSALNPNFGSVEYPASGITSNYQALQLQFQRSMTHGFQVLASYTWSHSIDFGSQSPTLPLQRADSDFDVRNNFQSGVTWDIPSVQGPRHVGVLLDHWGVDARLNVRSAFPITPVGNLTIDAGTGQQYNGNLNLVSSQPLYIYGSQYPGGRSINPAAFCLPGACTGETAPRNSLLGFGATQLNLAARREFSIHRELALQFRAEVFNIFNHPNFGYVDPIYTDATFGQATKMLNASLGTMSSLYQQGGPRSMQFALKLHF